MAWIKEGFTPLTEKTSDDMRLRLKNRMAFDSIIHGDATASDLNVLIALSNMTTALARKYGQDWKMEIHEAATAIEAMQTRYYKWKKVQATQDELAKVSLLMKIHDAQLDACRVEDLDRAISLVRSKERGMAA